MLEFYHSFFYQPLLNALIYLYETIAFHDLGIAIILLTVAVRIILFPLFQKAARNQAILQRLQPHLKKIKHKHKGDREKEYHETLALFKEHNITPFAALFNFLFLLIQLPVMFALFQIFSNTSGDFVKDLYSFVVPPGELKGTLFGLINLKQSSMVLVIFAAVLFYIQGKLSLPKKNEGEKANNENQIAEQIGRQMVFTGPIILIVIFSIHPVPAAVPLHLIASTVFSIIQQILVNKEISHTDVRTLREEIN